MEIGDVERGICEMEVEVRDREAEVMDGGEFLFIGPRGRSWIGGRDGGRPQDEPLS